MPAPGFYTSLLRGGYDVLPEDFDLEAPETEGILKKIGKGALGLLGTAGRALDWPARMIRRGITGLPEPTGRDVLKSLGIDIGPNKPGFDIGDIASFGTEVAFDPLTLVGGFAGKTAAGIAAKAAPRAKQALSTAEHALKVAEAAGDVERAARIAPMVERYAADVARLGDVAPLAPTWAGQAAAGQRQAFEVGIPFTRFKKSIPATGPLGQAFVGGVGTLGQGIAGTRPAKWLAEKFKAPTGLESTAGARAVASELERMAPITAAERMKTGQAEIVAIAKRLGKSPEEVATELFKPVEKPWPQFDVPLGPEFKEQEPAISALAQTIRTQEPLQLKAEQMAGLQTEELSDEGLAYLRRLPYARAKSVVSPSPFAAAKEHPTTFGAQMQRKEEWKGLTVPEINRLAPQEAKLGEILFENPDIRQLYEEAGSKEKFLERYPSIAEDIKKAKAEGGKGVFVENPVVAAAVRGMEGDKAMANAVLAKGLIKEFAKPDAVGPTVGEFLENAKLLPTGEDLAWKLPQDVADEFLKMRALVTEPEKIGAIRQAAEGIRKYMSQSLLLPYGAYHFRNQTTNMANTAIEGLFHPVEYARDWAHAAKGIVKGTPEARQWEAWGLLGGTQTREFSGEAFKQKIKELTATGEPGLIEKLKRPTTTPVVGGIFRTGQRVGEVVEGASRVAHYRAARRAGMDHLGAMESVKKTLFDYNELSDFEKKYLRPTVFFYTWQRRQLEMLVRALPERTGGLAVLSRATTQPSTERGPMPPWLRATTALPGGTDAEGNRTYWAGWGSPLEPIQNLDFLTYGIPQRIGSQLTPPLKMAIEALTGKDLRMQADISELNKSYRGFPYNLLPGYREGVTPKGTQMTTADPTALWLLRQSPFSRAASELGQAQDPRKDFLQRALNTLTGAKIVTVDESGERKRQAIEAINAQLQAKAAEGKAKLFKEYFATGAEGEKDPETQLLLKLSRKIRKGP